MISSNVKESEVKIVVMSEDNCELTPIVDVEMKKNRLSIPNHDYIPNDLNRDLKSSKNERSRSLDPTQNLDGFDPTRRRVSSISSLGNWTGAVLVSEAPDSYKKNGKWYFEQWIKSKGLRRTKYLRNISNISNNTFEILNTLSDSIQTKYFVIFRMSQVLRIKSNGFFLLKNDFYFSQAKSGRFP